MRPNRLNALSWFHAMPALYELLNRGDLPYTLVLVYWRSLRRSRSSTSPKNRPIRADMLFAHLG